MDTEVLARIAFLPEMRAEVADEKVDRVFGDTWVSLAPDSETDPVSRN